MKKKYLKKMLAIMLASMTVAATPGLVGAMKGKSKDAIEDANSKIKSHTLTIEKATNMLNDLEEIANEDDEAKAEVANTLGNMIDEGLFKRRSVRTGYYQHGWFEQQTRPPESLSKIINILKTCSNYGGARKAVAKAVKNMAAKSLLGRCSTTLDRSFILQCSPEQFSDIIDILTMCLDDSDYETKKADYAQTKEYVAQAILEMASRGVLGNDEYDLPGNRISVLLRRDENYQYCEESTRICSDVQLSKIMQFLNKCLQGNEPAAAETISVLVLKNLLNKYSSDKALNMLQECLKNPDAKKSVAEAMRIMAAEHIMSGGRVFTKDSINQILGILK